jgi:hypothetical protein
MSPLAKLASLGAPARRWSARLAGLFVLWALALDLGTGSGFVAAVASAPGTALLVLAGLAALLAAAAEPFTRGPRTARLARALALAGAGLLLASPPLSLAVRETRTLRIGEGQDLPAGALPGLPALRVGDFSLAGEGPFPLSKTVDVPLEIDRGAIVRVGLFPPSRLAGWRLAVFQFGWAPAVEWLDDAGHEVVGGHMMLGTFPRTEEEARLVEWLPEPNVMMGVGTFPPKAEDLVTPPGSDLHLHVRLQEATLAGQRRALASPDGWRWAMDGRPADPALFLEVFDGSERRFQGTVRAGDTARFPGGRISVAPEVLLWADVQAVRDPFVEAFLAGGVLLVAGALAGAARWVARLVPGVRRAGGA